MSEYRDEVREAVGNRGPAWNAIRAWHESFFERREQTLETMKQGSQLIVDADMALVALVELGVRLGLEAAARATEPIVVTNRRHSPHQVMRMLQDTSRAIRAIDAAAVLRKETA
jgi:hypothetical protein